ncbi:PAS domain-containing sensor histidine kinase [Sabulibacter ruber]|uniref:PAS domain-containing sensor histidine kinase n=1 Tax=Sabulibacter ruber TaxID=2811901 RepID=UPI001A96AE47|nr:PAS domain-containing sensor histidine kinase [Sabulibacter ruber]
MTDILHPIQDVPEITLQPIVGGGELGDLIRNYDWASTALGPIPDWSLGLRAAVNLMLQSPAPMVILWGEGGTLLYNDAYSVLAGQRHPGMLGAQYSESWPETARFIGDVLSQTLQGKALSYRRLPFTVYRNNTAEDIWLDLDCSPLLGDNGLPAGTLIITNETTEKVQADLSLKEHQERLNGVFNQKMVGIAECDFTGRFVLVNDRFCEMVGRSREELYQMSMQEISHPEDLPQNVVLFKEAIKNGTPFDIEKRYIRPDGSEVWVQNNVSVVKSPNGEASFMVAVCHEITQRKKAEKHQKLFLAMSENSPNFIGIADTKGKVLYVNPTGRKMVGLDSLQEALNTTVMDYFLEEDKPFVQEVILPAQEKEGFWKGEFRFRNFKTGAPLEVDYNQFAVKDTKTGEVLGIATVSPDITARKRAEEAIKESEERFRTMAEASGLLIAQTDLEGNAIYFNREWIHLTGSSMEDLLNFGWAEYFHPEDRESFVQDYQNAFANREVLRREFRLRSKTGEYRWQLAVVSPRYGPNGTFAGFISSCVDVTESKLAEEALAESEDRFRTFANNIQNLAWMADPEGNITWYNQRWYDFTGTTFEEVQGWGWQKLHHPDHVELVLAYVKEAWTKQETWELVFPLRRADGEYRWFLTRAYAVKNAQGKVVRWIGTNTDITKQKNAEEELQRRNEELQRTNNDLDNFIYTASHDLKAPITNIEGLVNTLIEDLPIEILRVPEVNRVISLISSSITRFRTTINDLTELTKLQRQMEEDVSVIQLQEIFEEICQDLSGTIQESAAKVEADFSQHPSLRFSKKNLRSVVYNLVSNAIKYRSPERAPQIRIASRQEQGYCILTIEDNGLGIDQAQKDKVFSMFKRLHDHVEGTGIGLYIVKKIMENSGGNIEVLSEVGKGSTFTIRFKL